MDLFPLIMVIVSLLHEAKNENDKIKIGGYDIKLIGGANISDMGVVICP